MIQYRIQYKIQEYKTVPVVKWSYHVYVLLNTKKGFENGV